MALPPPVFEGSEKRLEVTFANAALSANALGLRLLPRSSIDELMTLARCEVLSHTRGTAFDAYVLSESSLFVFPHKLVLKTCGNTKLLAALPRLLAHADALGLTPRCVRFTRFAYLFPALQPDPHRAFEDEASTIDAALINVQHFAHRSVSVAPCSGDRDDALYHVYVAAANEAAAVPEGATLEVCMSGLDPAYCANNFMHDSFDGCAKKTTEQCGLRAAAPLGDIVDAYVFDPCGYSMNGLHDAVGGFTTCHIAPEDACSYASVEVHVPSAKILADMLHAHVADAGGIQDAHLAIADSCRRLFGARNVVVAATGDATALAGAYAASGWHAAVTLSQSVAVCASVMESQTPPLSMAMAKVPAMQQAEEEEESRPDSPTAKSDGSEETMMATAASLMSSMSFSSESMETVLAGEDNKAGLMQPFVADCVLLKSWSVDQDAVCRQLAREHERLSCTEDSFYLMDLGVVSRRMEAWRHHLPRVTPFYAVKCNDNPRLLAHLVRLGCGFDSASPAELELAIRAGACSGIDAVSMQDRVVYANCCKPMSYLTHMQTTGACSLTTFDSSCELRKCVSKYPSCRLLLRIRADDPNARCQLGHKYGAEPEEAFALLEEAHALGANLAGVSFHVGSGGDDEEKNSQGDTSAAKAFRYAIATARELFDIGRERYGFTMNVLDIGGGFPGGENGMPGAHFVRTTRAIREELATHFPEQMGVRLIAEPGRYFAEAACTYATRIIGMRSRPTRREDGILVPHTDYTLSDGLYGSFNNVMYDHAELTYRVVHVSDDRANGISDGNATSARLFGPTCDGLDTVIENTMLPELSLGDLVVFPAMGAYTRTGSCDFNGVAVTAANFVFVSSQSD